MPDDYLYDVFVSHSSRDKAIVRAVAEKLREDGLRVWFDAWEIRPGDSIPSRIDEGLEYSRVLVLFMSANAFGSDWAQLESQTFRFRDPLNRERRFIPLKLDDSRIKGSLVQFSYIDWQPGQREQSYPKLLEGCRPPTMLNDVRPININVKASVTHSNSLPLLKSEFEYRPDNYVALMHVKVDWLEGSSDPTRMKYKRVAGPGVSQEETLKGGDACSLLAGINFAPEFSLSTWSDNEINRFYPNRQCKHWVTSNDGSIDGAISTWKHFRTIAERAGELVQRLGLRAAIDDPLQRWLLVVHDTTKPERISGGMVDKLSEHNSLPETMRLSNMLISPDWVGCSVISDLHKASAVACNALIEQVA